MNCERKTLELGERRRVSLEVWLGNGRPLAVAEGTWALLLAGEAEDQGDCETEQREGRWVLTAEIQPRKRRPYRLQYTFRVGTEIIKRSVEICVE